MKITFVLPFAGVSGGTRVVATYARRLTELGHEVTVISARRRRPPLSVRLRQLAGRAPIRHKPQTDLLDFLGPRHVEVDWGRAVDPSEVPDGDIIVATWWLTAEWVIRLPASKGRKFYLLQDYEVFPTSPQERVVATYRMPLKKLAVSGYIRDVIAANHGIADIPVIPNAIDLDQFDAPPRGKNQGLRVGFLHAKSPRKRVRLAIEAAMAARARLPDLQIVAFGANRPSDLPEAIDFHVNPAQEEIPRLYASCDLWLFPTEREGFGLPLLEAMACRTPVLATRAGAAPDLVDGTNGVLVDGTVEAFVDGITRFRAMPDEVWRGYSEAAHRTAHSYDWGEATERLLAAFRGHPEARSA